VVVVEVADEALGEVVGGGDVIDVVGAVFAVELEAVEAWPARPS
jgi:hypothetical protein